jgi:hypothetical protein
MILAKKKPMKVMEEVPTASNNKKSLGLPGKRREPREEKKKALRPKAARGNAVAVPRWLGQFRADILTTAEQAMQPPKPVR